MIRHATISDRPHILDMLYEFGDETPIKLLQAPVMNDLYVMRTIDIIQRSGIVLVSETDGEVSGMLMAQIVGDTWMPDRKYMKELCWYVRPQHRGSTAGYRLLKKYDEHCEKLMEKGVIRAYGLTTLSNSPQMDLEKRGWQRVETDWVKE